MDTYLFSERINTLMKRDKLSRAAVADKAGLSLTRLSNILTGNAGSVGADVIIGLCKCFDVSADYLLGLTESASTDTNMRAVADYTGLSDSFIGSVHYEKMRYGHSYLAEFFDGDGDEGRFDTLMMILANIADEANEARKLNVAGNEKEGIAKLERIEGHKMYLIRGFLELLDGFSDSYRKYGGIHHSVIDEAMKELEQEASGDGKH